MASPHVHPPPPPINSPSLPIHPPYPPCPQARMKEVHLLCGAILPLWPILMSTLGEARTKAAQQLMVRRAEVNGRPVRWGQQQWGGGLELALATRRGQRRVAAMGEGIARGQGGWRRKHTRRSLGGETSKQNQPARGGERGGGGWKGCKQADAAGSGVGKCVLSRRHVEGCEWRGVNGPSPHSVSSLAASPAHALTLPPPPPTHLPTPLLLSAPPVNRFPHQPHPPPMTSCARPSPNALPIPLWTDHRRLFEPRRRRVTQGTPQGYRGRRRGRRGKGVRRCSPRAILGTSPPPPCIWVTPPPLSPRTRCAKVQPRAEQAIPPHLPPVQ